eukprot:TRINITY_DN4232_c0_g1_i1.p1 TRINITY_DN4232_c0_g1~~TRINITY_DN4232_c0_g1_i1.p1  ORF type:complete len:797 (+),score=173.21 TRINITY_DN4232_c0_g1_i1:309-2699(+)
MEEKNRFLFYKKKNMKHYLITLFLCLVLLNSINCATYYVSTNGTGTNCTKEEPCTVEYVNGLTYKFGDIISLGCGNFSGLNVSNAIINGDINGCTTITTLNQANTFCLGLTANITLNNLRLANCQTTIVNNDILNITMTNIILTSSTLFLDGEIIRVEMNNVSSDKEIKLLNHFHSSLYFYIFNSKANSLNITSLFNIKQGSTISNLLVGKNAVEDPLSIKAINIGDASNPILIKTLKVTRASANGLNINAANTANVMLINSYFQSAASRSITSTAQNKLIFSVRNTQFYSSGSLDFSSSNTATNTTTLVVKIDSSSFSYINTTSNLLNIKGTAVDFKTCSSIYSNNFATTNVIGIEDTVPNSASSLKGFVSNCQFSSNSGTYLSFNKGSIDSKFLVCGNNFFGGASAQRALLVTASKFFNSQNNNFYDDNFSSSVIEVVSSNVQLNFTNVIFNGTSPNFVLSTKQGSSFQSFFENSLINPRTYAATACLNVNSDSSLVQLSATTFRNCDSISLNAPTSNLNILGNSSIYTVGYYQTNLACSTPLSTKLNVTTSNKTQICYNQLNLNSCFSSNITSSSCSDTIYVSRFNSSFIQPCQKSPCACYWQGDCSCNSTTPPALTLQTGAYCSSGTYYIYDYYPVTISTSLALQDSLYFNSQLYIKNTTKITLNFNGSFLPIIYATGFINVTGTLSLNVTGRAGNNTKVNFPVLESGVHLNGTFLTATSTTNYTVHSKCDSVSTKTNYSPNTLSLDLTYKLNISCNNILGNGAIAGIIIVIIVAIIAGVLICHKVENRKKN